ncbi:RNA polymerase sigma factor [Persicobacter psychrovividus]|uniref:DNA-directed RNA polymerase sigma-70 factor n=1 Tax=Persicobacter psychrovividus TaxID=387638 RepID=A0ABN6L7S6_9BACT|nr:DNA-directed RNA polymerase sigma-70 factor [Persicobacter psychrovividus]
MEEHLIIDHLQAEEAQKRSKGFKYLIEAYQERVYWHIRKMVVDHDDADDLTQEVFIKVHTHFHQFKGESALFTWIYRIASNEALAFLRKKRNKFFIPIVDVEGELIQKVDQQEYLDGDEIQLRLKKAILRLPPQQQLVFNMKYFDDLKYEQIAEIVGKSVGGCKANYHHAVKKIESFLQND